MGRGTKVDYRAAYLMVKEKLFTQMALSMKESGDQEIHMATVCSSSQMEANMKETGAKVNTMGRVPTLPN